MVAAMAMPAFDGVIHRYRVRCAAEDLTATIYLARSEAIRRGGNITLGKASSADCPTNGPTDWSCGWFVFADVNNNGQLDSTETAIQMSPAPKNVAVTIASANPSTYSKVNRWGDFGGLGVLSFKLRPIHANDEAAFQVLCLTSGGRLKTVYGTADCPGA